MGRAPPVGASWDSIGGGDFSAPPPFLGLRTEAATPIPPQGLEVSGGLTATSHSCKQWLTPRSPAGSFREGNGVGEVGNPGGFGAEAG